MVTVLPSVLAHAGQPVAPHDLWSSWGADPVVYAGLAFASMAYAAGLRRWWSRGRGRGVAPWRAGCFVAGLFTAWLAVESPVDALGSSLFSAHMLQHELLVVVAAPLLVMGRPMVVMSRALPLELRRRTRRFERRLGGSRIGARRRWLVAALAVYVSTFWVWHVPVLYNAALRSDAIHSLQHASFLLGALAVWVGVAGVHGHRTQLEAIALLGVIALQGTWGGALFVFASRPIYEPYLDTTQPWGVDPVDDISLGGVIMCVAGLAFVLTAVVRLVSLLLSLERGDRRRPTPTPLPT